ncbi:MAG: hypothetical protein ACR2PG_12555 [Hyphomicrobiaceae bacterium]
MESWKHRFTRLACDRPGRIIAPSQIYRYIRIRQSLKKHGPPRNIGITKAPRLAEQDCIGTESQSERGILGRRNRRQSHRAFWKVAALAAALEIERPIDGKPYRLGADLGFFSDETAVGVSFSAIKGPWDGGVGIAFASD